MISAQAGSAINEDETGRLGLAYLSILALGLGIGTGLGAVLFRDLIGLLHNLFSPGASRCTTTLMSSPLRVAGARSSFWRLSLAQ